MFVVDHLCTYLDRFISFCYDLAFLVVLILHSGFYSVVHNVCVLLLLQFFLV